MSFRSIGTIGSTGTAGDSPLGLDRISGGSTHQNSLVFHVTPLGARINPGSKGGKEEELESVSKMVALKSMHMDPPPACGWDTLFSDSLRSPRSLNGHVPCTPRQILPVGAKEDGSSTTRDKVVYVIGSGAADITPFNPGPLQVPLKVPALKLSPVAESRIISDDNGDMGGATRRSESRRRKKSFAERLKAAGVNRTNHIPRIGFKLRKPKVFNEEGDLIDLTTRAVRVSKVIGHVEGDLSDGESPLHGSIASSSSSFTSPVPALLEGSSTSLDSERCLSPTPREISLTAREKARPFPLTYNDGTPEGYFLSSVYKNVMNCNFRKVSDLIDVLRPMITPARLQNEMQKMMFSLLLSNKGNDHELNVAKLCYSLNKIHCSTIQTDLFLLLFFQEAPERSGEPMNAKLTREVMAIVKRIKASSSVGLSRGELSILHVISKMEIFLADIHMDRSFTPRLQKLKLTFSGGIFQSHLEQAKRMEFRRRRFSSVE